MMMLCLSGAYVFWEDEKRIFIHYYIFVPVRRKVVVGGGENNNPYFSDAVFILGPFLLHMSRLFV
jgi:hypothetical protein